MKNGNDFINQRRHIKHPLLEFDREISKIIAMCVSLRKELSEHKKQIEEMTNNFSSKVENNARLPSFIEMYSEIAKTYSIAYKDFSQAYPDVCRNNSDISNLINDLTQSFEEISSNFSFKTDFEEAEPILKSIESTLSHIAEIGNNLREKIQEIFAPAIRERNMALQIRKVIFWMASATCIFILGYAITKREAVLQVAFITIFWMLFLIWVKRDEKKLKQNGMQ